MKAVRLVIALFGSALAAATAAGDVARPKITGVAHIAVYAKDVDRMVGFYRDFLGYAEPFRLKLLDGGLLLAFVKVNDRQFVEIFPEKAAGGDRLNHIALEVEDAEAMRSYLGSRRIKVPDKVPVGRIGNANFTISDPDGHAVEIVQYLPTGRTAQQRGRDLPASRISTRMMHLGIAVGKLEPALAFYRDLLGIEETWRGSADGKTLSWVNVKVPDGDTYVEFMLYRGELPLSRLGVMHHLCLEVPDIERARSVLEGRLERSGYLRPLEIRTGINRKRQLNLFDPDGTRIELTEPKTVDGTPAPSSGAQPPQ